MPSAIGTLLNSEGSDQFWFELSQGTLSAGNKQSLFQSIDDRFTLDIGNGKILVNVAFNGAVSQWTAYEGNVEVDDIPGVWWHKTFRSQKLTAFEVEVDSASIDLGAVTDNLRTVLLGNVVPKTTFVMGDLEATLVSFAPISRCGARRPRASIHGLLLVNRGSARRTGRIIPPAPAPSVWKGAMGSSGTEALDAGIALADGLPQVPAVDFDLMPGQEIWVPVIVAPVPVLAAVAELGPMTAADWLAETLSYYRSVTGRLEMPEDPFFAAYFERSIHQCLHAFGMSATGSLVGSNWGSFPVTHRIWMKDMYYSCFPLVLFEPDLARRAIDWFAQRSIRPARVGPPRRWKGASIGGGVTHSLSNSLSPVLLAGLYYASTGDAAFFAGNEALKSRLIEIVEAVRRSRADAPLYPSDWISDGLSLGDFHTGSNLSVWAALRGLARILAEVYRDDCAADVYRAEADRLAEAIRRHCMTGPAGKRSYVEGSFADGRVLEGHDGEESDITLIPFYGFASFDDADYKRSMKEAISTDNPWYVPETRGLKWSENPGDPESPTWTDSTFPGYVTGFASITGSDDMGGPEGAFTQIRRLADLDGSSWWWSYPAGARFGAVSRELTGKCGWAAGALVALAVTEIIGARYDGPARRLSFRPFSPSSRFVWHEAPVGGGRFDLAYHGTEAASRLSVVNRNSFAVELAFELILPGDGAGVTIAGGTSSVETGRFMGRPTATGALTLAAGATAEVEAHIG